MSSHQIAVTPEGRTAVFLGFIDRNMHDTAFKYCVSVADREKDARRKYRFISLEHGNLTSSSFLRDDQAHRILEDRIVHLPCGVDSFHGVCKTGSHELDESLTRQLFGVTHAKLEDFIPIFNEVTEGRKTDRYWAMRHSRVTFSKTRSNHCDLSNALIPDHFPFIAFGETTYFSGHVSLHGPYRLLAFLCHTCPNGNGGKEPMGFMKQLTDAGASMEIIERMITAFFAGCCPLIKLEDVVK
jgi:hypothetical protein